MDGWHGYEETRGGILVTPANGLNEVCGHCGQRFAGSLGWGPACGCKPSDWPDGKRPRWQGSKYDRRGESE